MKHVWYMKMELLLLTIKLWHVDQAVKLAIAHKLVFNANKDIF